MATLADDREAARDGLLGPLQRAVSCVSKAVVRRGYSDPGDPELLSFDDRYVPLQGRHRLELSLLHTFHLRQRADDPRYWTATSANYYYQVREQDGPEIIAFHWHPGRRGQPEFPHLHVASHVGSVHMAAKHHVPTGRVSLESVVRFLIEELHARPLRQDWQRVLDEGQQHFDRRRSW